MDGRGKRGRTRDAGILGDVEIGGYKITKELARHKNVWAVSGLSDQPIGRTPYDDDVYELYTWWT